MTENLTRGARFRPTYVFLLTCAMSAIFIAMIWPFLDALLMAAIGAAMLHPVYRYFRTLYRGREAPAAVTTIFVVLIIIVGPLTVFLGIVVAQAFEVSETAIPWVREYLSRDQNMFVVEQWIIDRVPALEGMLPTRAQLLQGVGNVAQTTGSFLVARASKMTSGTAAFFLNLFVMLYAMFFFLISGRAVLDKILSYSPLAPEEDEWLVGRFSSVARATIKGSVVIGILQGALGGLGFAVAGIAGPAFWATVMAVLSIFPGVGSAAVWIPAVLYLFAQGETLAAVLLLVWCAGVVGTIDNVLRPKLVGRDAELPDLLIFLSTLGGLLLFGGVGFIVGPIIASLFLVVWEIYGTILSDPQQAGSSGA